MIIGYICKRDMARSVYIWNVGQRLIFLTFFLAISKKVEKIQGIFFKVRGKIMTPVMSIKNTAKYFAVGKFLNKFGAGQHYLFFGRGGVGQGSLENCLGRGSHLSRGKEVGFFDKWTFRGKFLSTGIVSHVVVCLNISCNFCLVGLVW